jgi:hypothetical protein
MKAWLKRFGLHLAAAVGAIGIFLGAASVGANAPAPRATPSQTVTPRKVMPERSLAGTIREVLLDSVVVSGVGGREWRISPAAGALIRLNGRTARLDALRTGDSVVILGQAQVGQGPGRFIAHAITARRK